MRWLSERRAAVGYLILAAAVALAFLATWVNDREIEHNRLERVRELNQVNRAQCLALQNLYIVIRKTLADADKAIDELAYYRTYPAERLRAHARNQETLKLFRSPPCPRDIAVGGGE